MVVFPFASIVPVPIRVVPPYTSISPPSGKVSPVTLSVSVTSIVVLPTVSFRVTMSITAVRLLMRVLDKSASV